MPLSYSQDTQKYNILYLVPMEEIERRLEAHVKKEEERVGRPIDVSSGVIPVSIDWYLYNYPKFKIEVNE
jgi:hypothetical protein